MRVLVVIFIVVICGLVADIKFENGRVVDGIYGITTQQRLNDGA